MSQRNGDKSRFNRVRRQNIRRREQNRALRASLTLAPGRPQPKPAAKSK